MNTQRFYRALKANTSKQEWVYGSKVWGKECKLLTPDGRLKTIQPNTLQGFTSCYDFAQTRIYEGDYITWTDNNAPPLNGVSIRIGKCFNDGECAYIKWNDCGWHVEMLCSYFANKVIRIHGNEFTHPNLEKKFEMGYI